MPGRMQDPLRIAYLESRRVQLLTGEDEALLTTVRDMRSRVLYAKTTTGKDIARAIVFWLHRRAGIHTLRSVWAASHFPLYWGDDPDFRHRLGCRSD